MAPPEVPAWLGWDVDSLIPHSGESVLLERIVDHDDRSTTTSIMPGRRPLLLGSKGEVAPWIVVEYMAQGIAVHEGIVARERGVERPLGFLASVADFTLADTPITAGRELLVRATRLRGCPDTGVLTHRCEVIERSESDAAPTRVAEGRLTIAIADSKRDG